MRRFIITAILGAGVAALALATPASAVPARAGKSVGTARGNVHQPRPAAPKRGANNNLRRNNNQTRNNNRRGDRNVVAGNTVVVGGNPGRGYYNNGSYNNRPNYYDDDDNDFLDFVGKTAAITAGVSIVSAVIGDVVKDKPDDCEPNNVGGQPYLNCNGVAYQQVQGGYQVVAPPQ